MKALFLLALYIGVTLAQKSCDYRCEPSYKPVCGNNWKTYINKCELMKASCMQAEKTGNPISLEYNGRCCKWRCDDSKYDTDDMDGMDKKNKSRENRDDKDDKRGMADLKYYPLCGSDGYTYYNLCEFKYHGCVQYKKRMNPEGKILRFKHWGECPMKCKLGCPGRFKPVCGSDGKTYNNMCHLKESICMHKMLMKNLTLHHQGACFKKCKASMKCPVDYEPVCGSDGRTYSNECELKVVACLHAAKGKKMKLKKEFNGECAGTCVATCPPHYKPVCGSNDVTFGNECLLKTTACIARMKKKAEVITQQAVGACSSNSCNFTCASVDHEVCGSDGKTYSSPCHLAEEACRTRAANLNLPDLSLKHKGFCKDSCERVCPDKVHPTCGTDGKTYKNYCELRKVKCKKYKDMMEESQDAARRGVLGKTTGWWPLDIYYSGECASDALSLHKIMKTCNEGPAYLCGSDGYTYMNMCHLRITNVLKLKKYGYSIRPIFKGVCRKM